MPDMLVKLYRLPELRPHVDRLQKQGVMIRAAMAYEKHQVVGWVQNTFGRAWASECDVSFGNMPVSCFIATANREIAGFACYESTCRNFFGPSGVAEHVRGQGIGTALLLSSLHAMAASGYAYAVIGGVGPADFYARAAGAIEIPGSSTSIYPDALKES